MVRVSSPAKLRPWSELTAKMVMGVVPGLVTLSKLRNARLFIILFQEPKKTHKVKKSHEQRQRIF